MALDKSIHIRMIPPVSFEYKGNNHVFSLYKKWQGGGVTYIRGCSHLFWSWSWARVVLDTKLYCWSFLCIYNCKNERTFIQFWQHCKSGYKLNFVGQTVDHFKPSFTYHCWVLTTKENSTHWLFLDKEKGEF